MFSPTTIASSTTIPSATINANIEIMLIVTSIDGRNRKQPMNEIGIPIVTQNASLNSRNSPNITMTRASPRAAFFRSNPSRCRYMSERSLLIAQCTPGGRSFSISSIAALVALETPIGVWPPTRKTSRLTARRPLYIVYSSRSSNVSRIVATSPSVRTDPSAVVISGIVANSRPQSRRSLTRSRMSPPCVSTVPPGISTEVCLTR